MDNDGRFFKYEGTARYKDTVYEINVFVPETVHWESEIKQSTKSAGAVEVTISSNSEIDKKMFKSLYGKLSLPVWVKYIVNFVPNRSLTLDADKRKTETFYVREDKGRFQAFTIEQINAMKGKAVYIFSGSDSKRRITVQSPENSEEKAEKALKTLGISFNGRLKFEKVSAGDGENYKVFEFLRATRQLKILELDKDKVLLLSVDDQVIAKSKDGEFQERSGSFRNQPGKPTCNAFCSVCSLPGIKGQPCKKCRTLVC